MIDPNEITTVRVGQLATAPFTLESIIPHEVANVLKKGTAQELSTFIASIIGSSDAVGFYPITVTDGGQLPNVPETAKFILVGKGTYLNVNGFSEIVCTKELNVLISVEEHWELSLEIPIEVDPLEIRISQSIRQDVTDYAPSENAIFNALNQYLTSVGSFHYADLATQTTPIATVANTPIKLTNDSDGASTNLSNAPYGITTCWNSITNQFDFTELSVGDCISLSTDINIDLVGTNTSYRLFMKVAIGSASEKEINLHNGERKSTDEFPEDTYIGFDIENEDFRDYPAELWITTDAVASIKINEWFLKIIRTNINVVKVKENYIHDFTSTVGQQTFTIPENYTLGSVFLNRTFLVQSEYTFSGGILTILETLETGTIISTR